jgi:hypothetical protein
MSAFNLPPSTEVNRVIPKNSFDDYATTAQKKLFSKLINRIEWTNKLSADTVNLDGKDITEIQIIKIELKEQNDIRKLLELFDKATPYHIIFLVQFDNLTILSATKKHPHPTNPDNSVIDWTFRTDWLTDDQLAKYKLNLQKNLDHIFKDFCEQIANINPEAKASTFQTFIDTTKERAALDREIASIKAKIKKSKQFNEKVELNQKLNDLLNNEKPNF